MPRKTTRKNPKKVNITTRKTKKQPLIEKPTTPPVWNPFELIENMDRWFWEDPWTPIWWRRRQMIPWTERWMEADTKITPLDLVDTGNEYKVVTEVPGVNKKDLEVNITPNGINICGETSSESKEEDQGYLRRERSYSTLCRNLAFPEEVNPDKAQATLKDGILEVIVPKKSPTKGRTIPVK